MKEDTQNCSWQDSIHFRSAEISNKNLFIFTGKGGTGKTSLALAWAKYLLKKRRTILFNDQGQNVIAKTISSLKIPHASFDLKTCMRDYMASRLKSTIIANWIMDTAFFTSLFKIIPSLGYITYLGKVIKTLQDDPDLTIIIDAESSGHALTMLESPSNFKNIFLSGLLTEDLHQITNYILNQNNTAIFSICNPSSMSINENLELIESLSAIGFKQIIPLINNSYYKINLTNLPDFLERKISMEKKAINDANQNNALIFPHIAEVDEIKIISELAKQFGEMKL